MVELEPDCWAEICGGVAVALVYPLAGASWDNSMLGLVAIIV